MMLEEEVLAMSDDPRTAEKSVKGIVGHAGEIILQYPTPQTLQDKIDEYFDRCFVEKIDPKTGHYVRTMLQPPTYAGLARCLGFRTVQGMMKYREKELIGDEGRHDAYSDILNEGFLRVEEYIEGQLYVTRYNPTGYIRSLEHHAGWDDPKRKEVSVTVEEKKPMVVTWADNIQEGDVVDAATVEKLEKAKDKLKNLPGKQDAEEMTDEKAMRAAGEG